MIALGGRSAPQEIEHGAELPGRQAALRAGEWSVVAAFTAFIVVTHVMFMLRAGALWRDEVNTVNVATMPSPAAAWAALQFDSFPVLWPLVLRLWVATGAGASDEGLRLLGLLIGLGVVAALWWVARTMGPFVPYCALLLVAASPTVLRWGDSLRAYGFGTLLLLLTYGLVWKVVERPSAARVVTALAAAVLSVHALFYNSILLLALCVGASVVGIRRREWTTATLVAGVGLVSASSLGVYARRFVDTAEWNVLVKTPITLGWLAWKFQESVTAPGRYLIWVWIVLLVLTIVVCGHRALSSDPGVPDQARTGALFVGSAVTVGVVAYALFLLALSYTTEPWYYIPLIAFLGVSFDLGVHLVTQERQTRRLIRLGGFVLLGVLISPSLWQAAQVRQTNVDVLAVRLAAIADEADLIVVYPWWPGVTFDRYYRGRTPWLTLPDINDHRLHRYDLVQRKMAESEPLRRLLDRIAHTLRSGRRVWLAGGLPFFSPDELSGRALAGQVTPSGRNELPYVFGWARETALMVQTRATTISRVAVPMEAPVSGYENLPLYLVEGWR